jgi:hypothetical protein
MEVVEARYAKPLSVLMMHGDEGRVLDEEPRLERAGSVSFHPRLDASVPSSD